MYKVTLTQSQISALELYIRSTTQMRKEEQEACERLGSELDEAGALKYPNMAANAIWWAETEATLQEVLEALDRAETKEESK